MTRKDICRSVRCKADWGRSLGRGMLMDTNAGERALQFVGGGEREREALRSIEPTNSSNIRTAVSGWLVGCYVSCMIRLYAGRSAAVGI